MIKKHELANDQPLVPEWSVSQQLNAFIVHDLKNLVTLQSHRWPGNVRELENLIKRAVVFSQRNILPPSDLGLTADANSTVVNLKYANQAIELDFGKKALVRNRGIVSRAARELGISRVNLYELIDKYEIRVKEFKNLKMVEKSELNQGR